MKNYIMEKFKKKVIYKKRGSKEILLDLALVVVGIVLLIAYRDQAKVILTSLATYVSTKIQSIFGSL